MSLVREPANSGMFVFAALMVGVVPASAFAHQAASITEAIEYADRELASERYSGWGALVLSIYFDGEPPTCVGVELELGRGRRYHSVPSNGVLVDFIRPGNRTAVRIRAPGYHETRREFAVTADEIVVIDDLVLQPVTDETEAQIIGSVRLEGDVDASDITVCAAGVEGLTDAMGRFRLPGLGSGMTCVHACVPGYTGLSAKIDLEPSQHGVVDLEGFRRRAALARWAYQPDGSRDLEYDLDMGIAILRSRELHRVSFGQGFRQVQGHSDFFVMQRRDQLLIRNFDVRRDGPGFVRLQEIGFDEILQAPDTQYARPHKELHEGAVFVFRCYDGEHYAKMEVLQILDGEDEYERALGDLARHPLDE